jgi:membrane protein
VLAVGGGALQAWLGTRLGWSSALQLAFAALRWAVIALALLSGIALLYRFGPSANPSERRRFAILTPGTVAATLALAGAALLFKVYVANFGSYDKTYGSLGAVIALLMWLFVTGLALLFGAEVDAVASRRAGAGRTGLAGGQPTSPAPRLA